MPTTSLMEAVTEGKRVARNSAARSLTRARFSSGDNVNAVDAEPGVAPLRGEGRGSHAPSWSTCWVT